jgi:hypothetical protein
MVCLGNICTNILHKGAKYDDDDDDDDDNNNNKHNKIINSNDRIAATMYSLGTLFVSGIYV